MENQPPNPPEPAAPPVQPVVAPRAPSIEASHQPQLSSTVQTKIAMNKRANRYALITTALLVTIGSLGIFLLTSMGSKSEEYNYVQGLADQATLIGYLMAAITGVFFAYRVAHPVRTTTDASKKSLYIWIALIIIGLFLGVIPGLILLCMFFLLRRPVDRVSPAAQDVSIPQLRAVNIGLVILGFILGVIPGLIWFFIISYPLSQHACKLSGSKYC